MSDGSLVAGPAFHELCPWNEGRLVGAKRALKQQQVWAIRFWLDQHRRVRDRALFDFAIDSKLRGCDVTCALFRFFSAMPRLTVRCAAWALTWRTLWSLPNERKSERPRKAMLGRLEQRPKLVIGS